MFRLLMRVVLAAVVPLIAAAAAAGADERIYVLHATPTAPELVVGPPLAQRMTVTVRGLTLSNGGDHFARNGCQLSDRVFHRLYVVTTEDGPG